MYRTSSSPTGALCFFLHPSTNSPNGARCFFPSFTLPTPLAFFGLLVPRIPQCSKLRSPPEKRSPFVVSLSLHFGACKPIQARLRLGLACIVQASSVGTPSVALSLQSFAIGFLLSSCWLLRPPETPSRLLPTVATFLFGGSPPAVLGSPQYPLAAALSRSRSFLLPMVAQTRTNSLACVLLTLHACCQYSFQSFRQHTARCTTEVAPVASFRFAPFRNSRSPPALGCSRRLAKIDCAAVYRPPETRPHHTIQHTILGLLSNIFEIFFNFFWDFFNTLLHYLSRIKSWINFPPFSTDFGDFFVHLFCTDYLRMILVF